MWKGLAREIEKDSRVLRWSRKGRFFPCGAPSSCWVGFHDVCAQACLTLCNPMDCSPPSFSIHGIFQARILEWVTIFFSKGSSHPRGQTSISCIGRQTLNHQSHLGSPPGPTVAMVSCPAAFLCGHPPCCRDHMTSLFVRLSYQGKNQSHATGPCLTSEPPIWAAPYPMDSSRTSRGCVLMAIC